MKILYGNIVPVWPITMTAIGHTRLVQQWVRRGHQVVAATAFYGDRAEAEAATGAKLEPFSPFYVDRFSRLREPKYILYSLLFFFHYLRLRRKYRTFDVVCIRNAFVGWCIPWVRRRFQAYCAISITDLLSGFLYWKPAFPRRLVDWLWKTEIRIISRFDLIFCITEEMKAVLVAAGIPAEKIRISGDGVDAALFDPAAISAEHRQRIEAELGPGGPRLLFYGNLHEEVVDRFLQIVDETVRRLPAARFIVIGKGDAHELLRKKAAGRPLLHLGFRPHEELPAYIAACQAGMIPYLHSQNSDNILTLKLLEFGAMGLPIVATPLKAIHRLFGGSPWIRFEEEPGGFAQALVEQSARGFQADESRHFRENFDWARIMDRVVAAIEEGYAHRPR